MKQNRIALTKMARIADMKMRFSQSECLRLRSKEAELLAALGRLRLDVKARADKRMVRADAALTSGADTRWQAWVEQQRAALNTELALLRARRSSAEEDLRVAIGKDDVSCRLLRLYDAGIRQKADRRQDYES